jgi:nucleotide-binding universal stress UspA family protein
MVIQIDSTMKTILVPTDFSHPASNALDYATGLASKLSARLLLLNVFWVPVYESDKPDEVAAKEKDFRTYANSHLRKTEEKIHTSYPQLEVESMVRNGFVGDEIAAMARVSRAEMIVMGTKGASGVEEALMGSNTTEVIQKALCPVLAVPSQARWHGIHRIVAAVGNHDNDLTTMVEVAQLAKLFKARVTLVHLTEEEKELADEVHLRHLRREVGRRTSYPQLESTLLEGDHLPETLEKFIRETKADLLVMATRKRNFLKQLFGRSFTRKMACHTHVPLLAFHAYDLPKTIL